MDDLDDNYEDLGPPTERCPPRFESTPTITVAKILIMDVTTEETRRLSGTELDALLDKL